MKPLRSIALCLLPAAVALAAATGIARAQQERAQACEASSCFGIDWRQPLMSQVAALPPGLATPAGATPLHYAVRHCAAPVVLYAMAELDENFNSIDPATGLPLLGNAILVCNTAAMRTLLELGASPLAPEPEGGNLLHFALRKGRTHFLSLMLQYTVDLEQRDDAGLTPLQLALWLEDRQAALQLLKAGADPNVRGQGGLTLIHLAVYRGDKELLNELLTQEADFNAADDSGRVPLHYAVTRAFDHEMATLFRAADAYTGPLDYDGKAPIHYASALADSASVAALLALRADPDQPDSSGDRPLAYALRNNPDVRVVTALLRMGADPNLPASDGKPLVQMAASLRDDHALNELIAAGADPNQTDSENRTLLHLAVLGGNSALAARLLDMGLDPDALDHTGKTPLELALLYKLGGPGGERFAQIQAERDALAQELREKRQAAAADARAREIERLEALRKERELRRQQRAQRPETVPSARVLENQIVRGQYQIDRLQLRMRNLPPNSPDEAKLAQQIEQAQQGLATKREQLAAQKAASP